LVANIEGAASLLLDALVLCPRIAFGTTVRVVARGAVTVVDGGIMDDKLICSAAAVTPPSVKPYVASSAKRQRVRYIKLATSLGLGNAWRGRSMVKTQPQPGMSRTLRMP
jgi:inorganic pyrophosphatase